MFSLVYPVMQTMPKTSWPSLSEWGMEVEEERTRAVIIRNIKGRLHQTSRSMEENHTEQIRRKDQATAVNKTPTKIHVYKNSLV